MHEQGACDPNRHTPDQAAWTATGGLASTAQERNAGPCIRTMLGQDMSRMQGCSNDGACIAQ